MELTDSETSSEILFRDIYNLPLLREPGDQSWRRNARCKGLSVDLFFPKKEDIKTNHVLIANARLVCAGCPVRRECLRFAIDNAITHGLYGGVMPRERRPWKIEFPNGEMPFTQVLTDFKRANSLPLGKPVPPYLYPELAKSINKPLEEIQEMVKAPDTFLLTSGS